MRALAALDGGLATALRRRRRLVARQADALAQGDRRRLPAVGQSGAQDPAIRGRPRAGDVRPRGQDRRRFGAGGGVPQTRGSANSRFTRVHRALRAGPAGALPGAAYLPAPPRRTRALIRPPPVCARAPRALAARKLWEMRCVSTDCRRGAAGAHRRGAGRRLRGRGVSEPVRDRSRPGVAERPGAAARHDAAAASRAAAAAASNSNRPRARSSPTPRADVDIAYVAYLLDGAEAAKRPVVFAINGGPGAGSVWLQLGALGPWRLPMAGLAPSTPPTLIDNAETWLDFADLVFLDPPGTGYSRPRNRQGGRKGGCLVGRRRHRRSRRDDPPLARRSRPAGLAQISSSARAMAGSARLGSPRRWRRARRRRQRRDPALAGAGFRAFRRASAIRSLI